MTMTIELSEATMAHLIAHEKAFGRPAAVIAAEIIVERFSEPDEEDEFPMDQATIEAIQRGIEDMKTGRTYSLEEASAHVDAALAVRFSSAYAVGSERDAPTLIIPPVEETLLTVQIVDVEPGSMASIDALWLE